MSCMLLLNIQLANMLQTSNIFRSFFILLVYLFAIFGTEMASDFCQFDAYCVHGDTFSVPRNSLNGFLETISGLPGKVNVSPATINDSPGTFSESSGSQENTTSEQPRLTSNLKQIVTNTSQRLPKFCCKDCLCKRNCGRMDESCCFPELTHTAVDELFETCTYAQSPIPHFESRHAVLAFYMVDTNPLGGCLDKDIYAQHPGEDCGNIEAADWGSLYPVSSVSTGKIYRNIHCAICHGINDSRLWQASIECENQNMLLFPILAEELGRTDCHINFENTEDTFNVDERRCFSGTIINYCSSFNFFVPESLGMNASRVVAACLDNIFSPYIHEHVYANVFCLICNNDLRNIDNDRRQALCERPDFGSSKPFTAILVPSSKMFDQKQRQHIACIEPQYNLIGNRCRSVFCPLGQTLIDGRCQYLTEMVYDADIVVNILILPTCNISLIGIENEIEELVNPIHRVWGENWEVQEVSVSRYLSSQIETILVTMMYNSHGVGTVMSKLLEEVKKNLNYSSNLVVKVGDGVVNLKQSNRLGLEAISRENLNELLEKFDKFFVGTDVNKEKLIISKTYETVLTESRSEETDVISEFITISILFYCKQVELYQDEFHIINDEIVYIKHLDWLLYKGQFINVADRDGLGPKIRICLHESGFSLDISSSSYTIAMAKSKIFGILVVHALVLFLQAIS